jgi:AraC-like DNA-binding protein
MDRFIEDLEELANCQSVECPPIAKLCEWTKKHPTTPLTLALAASVACVEPHYLSALFRRRAGTTFSRGINCAAYTRRAPCSIQGSDQSKRS